MRAWLVEPSVSPGDDGVEGLRVCLPYHEHHHYDGLPVTPSVLAGLQRVDPGFHPDKSQCRSCLSRDLKYVVFDTDTTGVSAGDVVVQLWYVAFSASGEELFHYERLWQGLRPSNPFALKVHGITDEEVLGSPHGT